MKPHHGLYCLVLTVAVYAATPSPTNKIDRAENLAIKPAIHPKTQYQFEQMREISSRGLAPIVFLGDDMLNLWTEDTKSANPSLERGIHNWQKTWAPMGAANFGLGGDRTEHVLWRIDHGLFDGLRPKVIVLLVGTQNSLAVGHPDPESGVKSYHCTSEQTAEGIRAILDRLKVRCPDTKVLLLGILPNYDKKSAFRVQNEATNAIIKDFGDEKTIFYMDIGAKFLKPSGEINTMLMPYAFHPSEAGYKVFSDAIMPKVLELMK